MEKCFEHGNVWNADDTDWTDEHGFLFYQRQSVAFATISVLIFYIGYIWQLKFSFQGFLVKGFKIDITELVVNFEAGADDFVAFGFM